MIHYFKIIRPVNILVVALTLLLFRYCIIDVEEYRLYDFLPYMNTPSFFVLLATTLLVTAGGYVINDIYDVDTDQLNKPNRLIVGKHLADAQAFNFYLILNGLAILGSFILMYATKQYKVSSIPIFVIVILYIYASTFKRMPLVGNIIVSICTAMPIILLSFYELRINDFDTAVIITFTQGIGLAAICYGFFAFLTNLIREIIKDIEDYEGDDAMGYKTLPIVTSIKTSKIIVLGIQLFTLSILLFISYFFLAASYSRAFYGTLFLLILPLLIQMVLVIIAKQPQDFKKASIAGKIHIFLGVSTLLYFYSGIAPHIFNYLFNFTAQFLTKL